MSRLPVRTLAGLIAAAALLAACGPNKVDAAAEPAKGQALADYAEKVKDKVSFKSDSALAQRFCQNAFASACPEGVETKLKDYGFDGEGQLLDMASAFTDMLADEMDGTVDKISTDDNYLKAAYKVALHRAPDEGGAVENLKRIKEGFEMRRHVLRSMIQSEEFKTSGG